jgi:predicted branched-subunit amino acid permease
MRAATRLWFSAAILMLLLAAFCFVLVSQFGTDRQSFVVVTVAGASVVGLVVIATTVLSLRALERRRSSLTRAL